MPSRSQFVLLAAILSALVLSHFSEKINPYFLDVTIGVGISVILAVSLNLINGYTGQFSLGHAGFMSMGAYTSAAITTKWGPAILKSIGTGEASVQALFFCALMAGGFVAALAGLAVGIPSLRLKGDYLAIVTLGFGEIIKVILQNVDAVGASRGMIGIPPYSNLFWTFGFAALTIYVVQSLVHSTYGRGFIAVSDDEVAAEAMGINTTRYKITAFVIGAFFAGIAGGIYAHFKQYISPAGFDYNKSIEIVVMVILGGMGNTVGVIIAAILLTLLPEWLRYVAGQSIGSWKLAWVADTRMILYSLILILMMLACPLGLTQVWHGLVKLWKKFRKTSA